MGDKLERAARRSATSADDVESVVKEKDERLDDESGDAVVGTQEEDSASPIPDGGLWAWLQVLSGFMLYLNSWGIVTSFGVFQSFYASTFLATSSASTIAWIGTIQGFLLAFTSVFAGPILDRGHPHTLILLGGFLVVFGLMMTSLCSTYWQLFLAQGVCVGLGAGQIFIVAVAVLPGWWERWRALATGLSAAGSAVGGVIYPIVFHRLQPVLGFAWAVRVLGFISLGTLSISLAVARMRTKPPPRPKIIDFTGFKELLFTLFCLLSFLGAMGLYVPYFFISSYAREREGQPGDLSFYMLPILSAGGILGRSLPGLLADRFGCLQTLTFTTSVSALLAFSWIAVTTSKTALIVWSLLYGVFSGPFVSLQTPTIAAITPDMRLVGGRMGMSTFCLALGVLVGNPIAGAIQSRGQWVGLQAFCGGTLVLSACLTGVTMGLKVRGERREEEEEDD
ncbi:hypothetical protein M409DRAFT_67504 [Zasmidium cellare ATCC 36951]|uniref:Major facilitator superfamily (MFS) profile domain-containing protein n=1 Tax=Zasmidium cellare ATCC 36951 TaxID=1080233 RepID=A0A6A6CDH5_ZASCE|nr:uncharacterized protein M409DRAFT_67504 [Zasmidium cellare ATCC 36951]KAF2165267.1 hypothetical protein M409DRAFT_67504 [Zasmidium cellare ATCC 36951]